MKVERKINVENLHAIGFVCCWFWFHTLVELIVSRCVYCAAYNGAVHAMGQVDACAHRILK